jgi:hypothetical protein
VHGFREPLLAKAGEGLAPSALALAIWGLSAATLAISSIWVAFGQRAATFVAGELRVDSAIGPLRVRRTRMSRSHDRLVLALAGARSGWPPRGHAHARIGSMTP